MSPETNELYLTHSTSAAHIIFKEKLSGSLKSKRKPWFRKRNLVYLLETVTWSGSLNFDVHHHVHKFCQFRGTRRLMATSGSGKSILALWRLSKHTTIPQNEATRTEIQSLWKKGDTKELERRMRFKRIFFSKELSSDSWLTVAGHGLNLGLRVRWSYL